MRIVLLSVVPMLVAAAALPAAAAPAVTVQAIDRLDLPCELDQLTVVEKPELPVAVGEYESLALLVTASAPISDAKLVIEGLPRSVSADTKIATPYRRKLRGNRDVMEPYLLESVSSVSFQSPGKSVYWLTFKAGHGVKPGHYTVTIRVREAATRVGLTVHPFHLRRDPNVFYGAFCGRNDRAITPQHMRDLHERGFDALQFFWSSVSVPIKNDSGQMTVDFSFADQWMSELQKSGMKGPVVWSLGNDSSSHLENTLSQVFGIPHPAPAVKNGKRMNFADIHNPELNRRLKELMLAIKNHAAEKKWPEIVFLIYDEPTERLMEEHENRYKFIKSFWPELRIYGVTMNRIEWAKAINHMVDILVANGDFKEISALAKESGKPFWLYGSASSRDEASLRQSYAWRPWANGAQAVWFWAYNYHAGDPYDDLDSRSPDSSMSMVWPPRNPDGPLVYSVSWDGMREAVDDMAYVQTLEWMLAQVKSDRAKEIRDGLEEIKNTIPSGRRMRVIGGDPHDTVEQVSPKQFVNDSRHKIAGWIEELLRSDRGLFAEIRER
jgi:hypothetical protein